MEWFLKVLKQYADFKGRARRKEYWMFTLFYIIFGWVVIALDALLFGASTISFSVSFPPPTALGTRLWNTWGVLYSIYLVALLVPYLAVWVRRLHDIGKSGWYCFMILIPFVGIILTLIWMCTDSQPGENKWGANPKKEAVD